MWLSGLFAEELKKSGFKSPYDREYGPSPIDIYYYKGEAWCLGGRVEPVQEKEDLLVSQDIYEKGVWWPTIDDLLEWLDHYGFLLSSRAQLRLLYTML
ncbi:hypothetical protein [Kroppenstedtia sanguinis]|uniref:Uncharacterized protein n=1 Tax=Kroppenstedtia sanguinis TaxID=1380684 RepID=A0ABW4CBY9_9BACL